MGVSPLRDALVDTSDTTRLRRNRNRRRPDPPDPGPGRAAPESRRGGSLLLECVLDVIAGPLPISGPLLTLAPVLKRFVGASPANAPLGSAGCVLRLVPGLVEDAHGLSTLPIFAARRTRRSPFWLGGTRARDLETSHPGAGPPRRRRGPVMTGAAGTKRPPGWSGASSLSVVGIM